MGAVRAFRSATSTACDFSTGGPCRCRRRPTAIAARSEPPAMFGGDIDATREDLLTYCGSRMTPCRARPCRSACAIRPATFPRSAAAGRPLQRAVDEGGAVDRSGESGSTVSMESLSCPEGLACAIAEMGGRAALPVRLPLSGWVAPRSPSLNRSSGHGGLRTPWHASGCYPSAATTVPELQRIVAAVCRGQLLLLLSLGAAACAMLDASPGRLGPNYAFDIDAPLSLVDEGGLASLVGGAGSAARTSTDPFRRPVARLHEEVQGLSCGPIFRGAVTVDAAPGRVRCCSGFPACPRRRWADVRLRRHGPPSDDRDRWR